MKGETLDANIEVGEDVADLLARAFRDNPMNRAVLRRGSEARVRANRLGARLLLEHAASAGHVLVECGPGADLVGALVGFGPDRTHPPRPSLRQVGFLLRQGIGATLRWGGVQSALAAVRPSDRHWVLSMIGVEPEAQGQGVGHQLVERWVQRIAAEPAAAWVETDRTELIPFYRGFGFELEVRCVVHGVDVVGLRRPAP